MSRVDELSVHLPSLRRYGRALTGCQILGDELVISTLQEIAANAGQSSQTWSRARIYRRFTESLNGPAGAAILRASATSAIDRDIDKRLAKLAPISKQAFLLVSMEGFSAGEAAGILGRSDAEFQQCLAAAGREIAAQVATDVLIIEDEPLIARDLKRLMIDIGHRVVGIARTHRDANAAIGDMSPGLVLADIQLADGSSGIDAVNDIIAIHSVPVVFITANPDRYLTGLRPEPTFLVTKPFDPRTVRAIVSQALFCETVALPKCPRQLATLP